MPHHGPISVRQPFNPTVESPKKSALRPFPMMSQKYRRKSRRQRKRIESRNRNRKRNRQRELPEQNTRRPWKQGYRHENRNQYQGRRDDRPGHFFHRHRRRIMRLRNSLGDMPLDVLDHHDRVVNDQSGGQGDPKQRQSIDRKSK